VAAAVLGACTEKRSADDSGPGARQLRVEDTVPDFTLSTLRGGDSWSLADHRGKVVIVNFWATWCPPCKEELPSLQSLLVKTLGQPEIEIVTILYRDSPDAAREYLDKMGFSFTVLLDPEERTADLFGITGVPETYVIDPRGVLRNKVIGPMDFADPDNVDYLKRLATD
jgi:peroxiredoxin